MKNKLLIILLLLLFTPALISAQHNYDDQSVIYSDGPKVGIGTSNPEHGKLQIYGEGASQGITLWTNQGEYTSRLWINPTSKLFHISRTSDPLKGITIKNNGYVGIGNVNPNALLEISGTMKQFRIDAIGNGNDAEMFFDSRLDDGSDYNTAKIIADAATGGINPNLSFYVIDGDGSGWNQTLTLKSSVGSDAVGNVGIGTLSPTSKLEIFDKREFHNAYEANSFVLRSKNASSSSDDKRMLGMTIMLDDDNEVHSPSQKSVGIFAQSASSWSNNVDMLFYTRGTSESPYFSEKMRIESDGNVGIGITNPTYKLTVDGTISAKEVKVSTTPNSDYVFEPNYKLRPIEDLEVFVKQNKHLPDIPSAEEFKENGVGLGEMDDMLLRKVEELTLYTIKQEKKIEQQNKTLESKTRTIQDLQQTMKSQEKRLENQQKEIEELKNAVKQLMTE